MVYNLINDPYLSKNDNASLRVFGHMPKNVYAKAVYCISYGRLIVCVRKGTFSIL